MIIPTNFLQVFYTTFGYCTTGFFFGLGLGLKLLDFDLTFKGWDYYKNSFERTRLIYEGLIRNKKQQTFFDF